MSKLSKNSLMTVVFGSGFYWLSFYFLDQPIASAFHQMSHTSDTYLFFDLITFLADAKLAAVFIVMCFIIAAFTLFKKPQSKLANHLLFMGIAMLAAIFFETTLKYLLGRYRPELFFQEGLYGFHFLSHQFLMNSTPSGHATRMFVYVAGCSLAFKRLTPFFVLIGIVVCLSRLVLELHYLSDVVFGAWLGTLITLWIAKIYYSMTLSHTTFAPVRR